ncbi:hypothetical protein QE379_001128 [Sphingomonas sp. SORGH_AS 879]|nr:hypothetical protein [Sphingomonas sp. SORGH_AS_0879]
MLGPGPHRWPAGPVGTLNWTLTILAANGAVTAGLLVGVQRNRMANRFLAALVGLISLRLGIYVLGFASACDEHLQITFLPLDASLANCVAGESTMS